jgi:hypothetical protein
MPIDPDTILKLVRESKRQMEAAHDHLHDFMDFCQEGDGIGVLEPYYAAVVAYATMILTFAPNDLARARVQALAAQLSGMHGAPVPPQHLDAVLDTASVEGQISLKEVSEMIRCALTGQEYEG